MLEREVIEIQIEMLCENKGWFYVGMQVNELNGRQWLVNCLNENRLLEWLLVTESGRILRLLGNKQYEEIVTLEERKDDRREQGA